MLVDRAIIEVRSGKGGDGCASFRREKYVPKGGPNGGDGGRGGSVILVAKTGIDTLGDLGVRRLWRAADGKAGMSSQKHGRNGEDLTIGVPPGTLVYDEQDGTLLTDLDAPHKHLVAARGGRGGFGNEHFKSATDQAPVRFTTGEASQQHMLRLELKLVADVGLVGLPNAGKSTMLAAVSSAKPKIADYPFTTLEPHLGIAELPNERHAASRRLVLADIPGLIEGASRGKGLGDQFLRHIERTRLLIHLVDAAPPDGTDPATRYGTICAELAAHSAALADKPQIVVLNKVDLVADDAERCSLLHRLKQAAGASVMATSSATRRGLRELLEECWRRLEKNEPHDDDDHQR